MENGMSGPQEWPVLIQVQVTEMAPNTSLLEAEQVTNEAEPGRCPGPRSNHGAPRLSVAGFLRASGRSRWGGML